MLIASIMEAPVFGAKVKSYDEAKAKAMPGVRHVMKVGDTAVAVVADTWWQADKALKALNIAWEEGPNDKVSSETIMAFLKEGLEANDGVFVGNKIGDAPQAIAGAAKKLEAIYYAPLQNHACMEPMNCTAKWTADKCEVWVATQTGEGSLAAAAEAAGLPPAKCEVYKLHLGGGFGRRGFQDYVDQGRAARQADPGHAGQDDLEPRGGHAPGPLQARRHVQDDGRTQREGRSGRAAHAHLRAVDPGVCRAVTAGEGRQDFVAFQGLNEKGPEGQFGYTIPNVLIDHAMRNMHVPPGFWRGVNNNQNAIWLETFIDQLAKAAGKDPLEFRRQMMANHPKHLGILNAVADKIGWGKTQPAAGVFRGIAQHMGYGSYVAAAAEVSVSERGKLKVHRLVMGTDSGHVVNPDQVTAQVEGSVAYGLSALLYQECTVQNGRIVEENFDAYPVMLMEDFPKIETVLVPSGGFWGGVGEPTICVAAPAVLNAIYAATGKSVTTHPLKNVKPAGVR